MAKRSRRQLSEHEREERRRVDRERMQRAAEQLLSSDGWQRWVRVRSRNGLSRYSINNQLLIALVRPDASYVAGFHAWVELGYQVGKGEKAIWILAPMTVKQRQADGDEKDERRVFFRGVPVFDRAQVAEIEGRTAAVLEPPCEPVTGDSHEHLLEPLSAFATGIGFSVSFQSIAGSTGGWCDRSAGRIVVDASQPVNAQVRILVHELAHAMGVDYERYGRRRAEVIVDTVSFIVCAGAGLNAGGETIPYVAGWGEDGGLEAVSECAATIDSLARRLEDVIHQAMDPTDVPLDGTALAVG